MCRGRLYTGITLDLEARFKAHMAGKGAKFTRSYKPERIVLVRHLRAARKPARGMAKSAFRLPPKGS